MFSFYLDGISQPSDNIKDINKLYETSIVREDGFDNSEQIIRERSEMSVELLGTSYQYIVDKIASNSCDEIQMVLLDNGCGIVHNWIIKSNSVETNPSHKTLKTAVKDNSFSGYIRDFMDNEIFLYNTNTKNCQQLSTVDMDFTMFLNPLNTTETSIITAFDALDVIKYIVSFFTDNTISVVSDYLTDNKYAITTGFNLHAHGLSIEDSYPKISLTKIFYELRRKLHIYMAIENDAYGNPYLRIESESYFFNDNLLFEIKDIPSGLIQKKDLKRNFSIIKAGSSETELQDGNTPSYTQDSLVAWNEETFNFCGTCSAEKNNILDLVSSFIIDSNLIYEGLNSGVDDYANDSAIFMFNYELVLGIPTAVRTFIDTVYVYNIEINNESIINNWIDYAGKCLILNRTPKYGFLERTVDYTNTETNDNTKMALASISLSGFVTNTNKMLFVTEVYDNKDSVQNGYNPYGDAMSIFRCQENGQYNFEANVTNIRQRGIDAGGGYAPDGGLDNTDVTYELRIHVYTDDTLVTLIDTYLFTTIAANAQTDHKTLTVKTGLISLGIGNAVICELFASMPTPNSNIGATIFFFGDSQYFKLIEDSFGCINIDYNNQDSKPFVIDFDYPICQEDFNNAVKDKSGKIMVAGNDYWIKELIFRKNHLSSLTLIGNNYIK